MRFSVDWRDDGENAAVEERASLCELKISVGGENACLFLDVAEQRSYDALLLPAVHLAEGIAHDWWRIFGARDRKRSLLPYRTGFALPALQFGCDGATFEIEGRGKHKWAPQAETFALARAIGSALCISPTSRRVVNGLHDAEEQAIGRAFAAEFLAPVEKIVDMKTEGLEEYEIAQEFQVSEQVVAHQLENHERIAAAQGSVSQP